MREQLFIPYWSQWLADTTTLLQQLPEALNIIEQNAPVVLTFERWLLELKVRPNFTCVNCSVEKCYVLCLKSSVLYSQGLRRLTLFGFQSDAKSLQNVPAVAQVSVW